MGTIDLCKRGRRVVAPSAKQAPDIANANFLATLVAIASHDLRQPLQLVRSAHNALATLLQTEEQWGELSVAETAIAQLVGMLDQLVEAVRLHECSHHGLDVPTPLSPILDRVALELGRPARSKGITFRVNQTRTTVFSHPVLLTGLLRNLIRNAIDYTPSGGIVSVTCEERDCELHIHVCDTGCGIEADALAVIFNAFQCGQPKRTDGLGLGLFIVKRAAELLGHHIHVHSAEGYGSRFTIVTRAAPPPSGRVNVAPLDRVTLPDIRSFAVCGEAEDVD